MSKTINRLSARSWAALTDPGRHADGANLYLSISPSGAKGWLFVYKLNGKQREMGLGSASSGGISLVTAREFAAKARGLLAKGEDPLAVRQMEKRASSPVLFGTAAKELIAAKQPGWKNAKHGAQWSSTLSKYASKMMDMPVDKVDANAVLAALQPIWKRIPETANRLRGRIEAVLDYARVKKYRVGENPAVWRGNLQYVLPPPKKLARGPQASLEYGEIAPFMQRLRTNGSCSAMALEFTILTAARTCESIGAKFTEINWEKHLWSVPPERMKGGKKHEVPLSVRAMELARLMRKLTDGEYLFPGLKKGSHLSNMAMLQLLEHLEACVPGPEASETPLGRPRKGELRTKSAQPKGKTRTITVHGFRSTFSTWCSEETDHADWVCEMALAHVIANKVTRAYRRGELLQKRSALMDDWAQYCSGKPVPHLKLVAA